MLACPATVKVGWPFPIILSGVVYEFHETDTKVIVLETYNEW